MLLVEDDAFVGQSLVTDLGDVARVEWVKTFAAAEAALTQRDPDLALLDIRLPDHSFGGLRLAAALADRRSTARVIVMTAYTDAPTSVAAMHADASYVVKAMPGDDAWPAFVAALRDAISDVSDALGTEELKALATDETLDGLVLAPIHRRIAHAIGAGIAERDAIADELHISVRKLRRELDLLLDAIRERVGGSTIQHLRHHITDHALYLSVTRRRRR